MKKKDPNILIIIVTWNKKQYVVDLLNSLKAINYTQKNIDVVVVDNASNDGTQAEINTNYPHIHLICNSENLGGTGGFNTGLAYAFEQSKDKYDYLWLLDNDVQVNKNALASLVDILENNADIAVAGSTMMQMDYRWRINEMGAFVDRGRCTLQLNRFLEQVSSYQNRSLAELLLDEVDLSKEIMHCQPYMDVDYVAAASLLIKADIAKESGLWDDYFIHFDDVEWCLRIAAQGHRIVVSAQSLIWHMSADTKVPDWILYYDNRNALYLLNKHSAQQQVDKTKKWILKKALYYTLLAKADLARLHFDAIDDYNKNVQGKKNIQLDNVYHDIEKLDEIFSQSHIKRILIPWTVNLQATRLQEIIVKKIKSRDDFKVDYLMPPANLVNENKVQLPATELIGLPKFILMRYLKYFSLRNRYDLVLQSDYRPLLPLSWLAPEILYVNYANSSLRKRVTLTKIKEVIFHIAGRYF